MSMYGPSKPWTWSWFNVMSGTAVNGDLWLWEAEDEECIKVFAQDLHPFPDMPPDEWTKACSALEVRRTRTTLSSSLAHITPQTRLRFITWLMVVGLPRRGKMWSRDFRMLGTFILDWAKLMTLPGTANFCGTCRVSHFLPTWLENMLAVYLIDDLRSIPWDNECSCLER